MSPTLNLKRLTSNLMVLLASLLLFACTDSEASDNDVSSPKALALDRQIVLEETIHEPILGTGTMAAHKTTNVGPRVDGIVEEVFVAVGDRVKSGQTLFRTRQIEYRLDLDKQEAALSLVQAESQKTALDLERARKLYEQNIVPIERLDEATAMHRMAEARVATADVQLAEAKQRLTDTLVKSPFAGVVTKRFVDEGAFVRTMLSSNSPVIQVMKTDIVVAIVHIPEVHLARIKKGTPATLTIDGMGQDFESEVYIINDLVEHESHAVELRLPLRNEDLEIKPGLFVKVAIHPEPRTALVVNRGALLGSNEDRYVFVEDSGVARRRTVIAVELDARRAEILSGIAPGDTVLSGPDLGRLVDGTDLTLEGVGAGDHASF